MNKRVFAFNYVLRDKGGQILDQSDENHPLPFLEGMQQIIPGLESQVISMTEGDKKKVALPAKDAYGEVRADMVMKVPRKELNHIKLEIGAYLQLDLGSKSKVVRITEVGDEEVTLDGNHPLAGVDLEFEIEMVMVREATQEELTHGHAHGLHGHSHHH